MSRYEENAKVWQSELKECDFAGQLDLSEDDLRGIAPQVQQGFERRGTTDVDHAARIVFAVNCAYYALDEGFWDYCCRLLHHVNSPQVQTELGRKIEASLIRLGFLQTARYGPFRCVGPLLEQIGVTRRSIPSSPAFSGMPRSQLEEMLAFTFARFIAIVETLQPGTYLGYFLKSETKSGWEFTRAIARSLGQYERGLVSWKDLQTLPGYRPGFWIELKTHMDVGEPAPERRSQQCAPLPRLIFDPITAQVQISFNHDWVERRAYTFEGEIVESSRWPLTPACGIQAFVCVWMTAENKTSRRTSFRGWGIDHSGASGDLPRATRLRTTETPVPSRNLLPADPRRHIAAGLGCTFDGL